MICQERNRKQPEGLISQDDKSRMEGEGNTTNSYGRRDGESTCYTKKLQEIRGHLRTRKDPRFWQQLLKSNVHTGGNSSCCLLLKTDDKMKCCVPSLLSMAFGQLNPMYIRMIKGKFDIEKNDR